MTTQRVAKGKAAGGMGGVGSKAARRKDQIQILLDANISVLQ